MIPKVIFRYSWIYDEHWKAQAKYIKGAPKKYPSEKEIQSYIKKIKPLWRKHEKRVLSELVKITRLKWKSKIIKVYVVGIARAFSDPLTLPIYKSKTWFIDTLTHELIHQLFIQNLNTKKTWSYFFKKYKKYSLTTIIHLPLHAIHWEIYLRLFGEKRLRRNIEIMSYYPDYRKAWEIVEKEGHKNIIKEFTSRLK